MAASEPDDFPAWQTPEGEPVSCVEKIKVLNENLAELAGSPRTRSRTRVLMGCDEAQIREVLAGYRRGSRQPLSEMRPGCLAGAGGPL